MKKITCSILVAALMGVVAPQNLLAQDDNAQIGEKIIVEEISNKPIKDSDDIYFSAEQVAYYPGGDVALMQYIASAIQYPVEAQEEGVQGRVIIQFVVEKDGSIGEVKVVRGRHPALDAEAVRVVKNIPEKFIPGKVKDEVVRYWFTLPINFKLNDEDRFDAVLSKAMGISMGGGIAEQLNSIPDSAFRAKMSKEDIYSGIEYVLAVDTASYGKAAGLSMGLQLAGQVMYFEELGVKVNRKKLLDEFKNALMADSMETSVAMKYNDYLDAAYYTLTSDTSATNKSNVDADSIAIAMGSLMGGDIATQINMIPDSVYRANLSKDDIYEVIEYEMSVSESKISGISIGLQLYDQTRRLELLGAKINRGVLSNELKNALFSETLSKEELERCNTYVENVYQKLQEEAEKKYLAERANSPEATYNKLEEEKFMANLKTNDNSVKFTESGVGYKVIKKGKGSAIANETMIEVAYKGSLINGTVFDDSEGQYIEFDLDGVVPGFADGLRALNKGDKAILYIPGALAYGVMGQPAAGIEPNQMLIFEVEISDPNEKVTVIDIVEDK